MRLKDLFLGKGCGWAPSSNLFVEKEKIKETSKNARIKILGVGCSNCKKLEKNTLEAVKEIGDDLTIENVKEMSKIAAYGVMSTPALVLDEKVLSYGKVLSKDEIIELLKEKL